jgi:hypothetical protein
VSKHKLGPFGRFLSELMTNAALLERFLHDRASAVAGRGLSPAQESALITGDSKKIEHEFLQENPAFQGHTGGVVILKMMGGVEPWPGFIKGLNLDEIADASDQ